MVAQVESPKSDIIYPERDGNPMSDNTIQFRWITIIEQNLEWLFVDNPNVFVAGDLLWYPLEGNNKIRCSPDVMVVFGVPKGDRGSYQQWREHDISPQVVFEILSPGNTQTEMNKKLVFYDRYGVEEYYVYDPDKIDLGGWFRSSTSGRLDVIEPINNWVSPRLGIRFDLSGEELKLIYPDGQPFASYVEISQKLQQSAAQVEQERLRAE